MNPILCKFKRLISLALLPSALLFSANLIAGEQENRIIDNAVNAYGGDKLLSLKNYIYTDTLYQYVGHQSGHALQGPVTQHLNEIQLTVSTDFENQRSELKRATKLLVGYHDNRNLTATHRLYKEGKGVNIDHFLQAYQDSDGIRFDNADLAYSRMLDPVIIRNLADEKDKVTWIDIAYIQGEAHDVLTIHSGMENEYSVYINQESGLLSRMLQKRGSGLRTYNFLQYKQVNGITWAQQLFVGTEQQPVYQSNSRQLAVNLDKMPGFDIPKNYQVASPALPFDVSQLTIRELAQGVFYVGQGWGYTLFIDAGEYYISAGAWGMADRSDDWQQALNLLHQTTGNNKPVKQHLVSHHHSDHMSELPDVLDHDAKLLVHPGHVKSVRDFLKDRSIMDEQFITINTDTWLADNKIMLFDAPNSQASHNLAIYLPESKIVFAEDVFGSSYQQQHHSPSSWPHMDTYQRLTGFMKHLQELDIHMDTFVSSHHGRVLSAEEIKEALKVTLPSDEVILQRLFTADAS